MPKFSQQQISKMSVIERHRLLHQLLNSFKTMRIVSALGVTNITSKNLCKLEFEHGATKPKNKAEIHIYGTEE